MNRKISRNEKQVLKRRKVVPWWRRKHKCSNKYWSGGWQQHFWIVAKLVNNLRFIILIFDLSSCSYFCFSFTFTVYTNILNAADFMVKKGRKKNSLRANTPHPPTIKIFSFFHHLPPLPPSLPTISFLFFFQPPLLFHTLRL